MDILSLNQSPKAEPRSIRAPATPEAAKPGHADAKRMKPTECFPSDAPLKAEKSPPPIRGTAAPPPDDPSKRVSGEEGARVEPNAPPQIPDFSPENESPASGGWTPDSTWDSQLYCPELDFQKPAPRNGSDPEEAKALATVFSLGPILVPIQAGVPAKAEAPPTGTLACAPLGQNSMEVPGFDAAPLMVTDVSNANPVEETIPPGAFEPKETVSAKPVQDGADIAKGDLKRIEVSTEPSRAPSAEKSAGDLETTQEPREAADSREGKAAPIEPRHAATARSEAKAETVASRHADTAQQAAKAAVVEPRQTEAIRREAKAEVTDERPIADAPKTARGETANSSEVKNASIEPKVSALTMEELGTGDGQSFDRPSTETAIPTVRPEAADAPKFTTPITEKIELAPVQRDHVLKQVADRLEALAAGRLSRTVTIHLEPLDFGSITLTVKQDRGEVNAEVHASNEAVRQALETSRSGLTQTLEQKGLTFGNLVVGSETSPQSLFSNSGRQQQEQAAREAQRNPNHLTPPSHGSASPTLTLDAMRNLSRKATGVDLWI